MFTFRSYRNFSIFSCFLIFGGILLSFRSSYAPPPPGNDSCSNALPIAISGGGFDYGTYVSDTAELTTATREASEFFQFAPNHTKSIWFTFDLETRRSTKIEIVATAGSIVPDPNDAGVTVYQASACLPGSSSKLGAFISSGDLSNPCLDPGKYLIQVTGVSNLDASVYVKITLGCPDHPTESLFDCPAQAYLFNSGAPLTGTTVSVLHAIQCHSIEEPSEYACLPIANKNQFLSSSWYVFTTGSVIDFLDFYFFLENDDDVVGYRLLEGNVQTSAPSTLTQIDCGVAKERFNTRFIEFPCMLDPSTTYSLVLLFHEDFAFNTMRINARQRGVSATGWPRPVLPPVIASNQLGVLPGSLAPGTLTEWSDRFDCNSFISNNICAPANPASGEVIVGGRRFNLATWATFSLTEDANVEFRFNNYNPSSSYHTRIFDRTIAGSCPSPNPAGDLYFEFSGNVGYIKCMLAGDYSIQVLSSALSNSPSPMFHEDAWSYGSLGTEFRLGFTVENLPSSGQFRLDAPGEYNAINNLNPLINDFPYPSTPAVFVCRNTVLPSPNVCGATEKAMYREVNIGDANGDGMPDSGLLTISGLRTDEEADPPIVYSLLKGDANQLATAAGTHSPGQFIPGLEEWAGFCIDEDDYIEPFLGIEQFCACVTPGVYTVAGIGGVDHVGQGDSLGFRFNIYETIHDSRANAELVMLGPAPDTFASAPDVFSCVDNIGSMPSCGGRRKLIFREFHLTEEVVVTITEGGSANSVVSLFKGKASDLSQTLEPVMQCFLVNTFIDNCTTLDTGWYTLVSYGEGPNYTNRHVWPGANNPLNYMGDPRDVGKSSVVIIALTRPIIPNFNTPPKAHQAGITDWATPPVNLPNAITRRIYSFPRDTFCEPDTPFIPDQLTPCANGYNRVSFYVFEVTKPSFVQIRNLDPSYYTEVYPFDVNASPGSLLTVPPVYQCFAENSFYRQICDLPPGKYTIAIQANDGHKGAWIAPAIYVDAAYESRFDHAWKAYDFDVIPRTNVFVDGRKFDTHPTIPGQAPSRDVFYCTTGATNTDPNETQCFTQLNPLIYAEPAGVPKPLFLPTAPPLPRSQPWRNLWYTFMLSGSGIASIHADVLGGTTEPPLIAVYESDADADIPWATLQSMLNNPGNTIIPGLRMLNEHVDIWCDSEEGDMMFTKSGCVRDSVRYYVVVSFDVDKTNYPPNLPNQTISLSVKFDPRPTFAYPYDERPNANVINGLVETAAPYTSVPLVSGSTFMSTGFSLLCYTKNVTDPPGCNGPGKDKSAWFKFEVGASGYLLVGLEELGFPGGWFADSVDMTVWRDSGPNNPLTDRIPLNAATGPGHEWVGGCISPGTYYLLVRDCEEIDTIQPYRVVLQLTDSPGDFCSNAIPIDVTGFTPVTGTAIVDCHSIGTDVGEFAPAGNTCFQLPKKKTTWYHATVNAGPMVDLNFQLQHGFETASIGLNDVSYRILAGNCGAMTPIVCSAVGTNVITLNCLGPGDYYIQVAMPQKIGPSTASPDLQGTLSLIVTATPSNPVTCTEPTDPFAVSADFLYTTDCEVINLFNLSTAGTDITYLWQFPNGTSVEANPVWTPPGPGIHQITLIVTNIVLNRADTVTLPVSISEAFALYTPLRDTSLCNGSGSIVLDATVPGATYEWDNNTTNSTRIVTTAGTYSVIIRKDGCEKHDTAVVEAINAMRTIAPTICPESSITIHGEVFNKNNPTGTIVLPDAHPSGCDSILTIAIDFYAPAASELNETMCDGETYVFAGQSLTTQGTYLDTLVSSRGCDSIVTLNLSVTTKQILTHEDSSCIGIPLVLTPTITSASYEWDNGDTDESRTVSVDGLYQVTVTDTDGCVVSEESFDASFDILASAVTGIPNLVCPGSDVQINASGSTGNYVWYDSPAGGNIIGTGTTLVLADVWTDSLVYVEVVLSDGVNSCVSNREPVPVVVTEETAVVEKLDTLICAGNSLVLPWGEEIVASANDSFQHTWINSVTGCDSLHQSISVNVVELPPLSLPSVLTLHLGDSILLVPQIDFTPDSLLWSPAEGLSCTNCRQPWAYPVVTTEYEVQIWSPEGCYVNAVVRIEVKNDIRIYIPNVFTPNDDGTNDLFSVYAKREVALVRKLTIFDRWGEAVWQDQNFNADGSTGWNGIAWGKPMQSGVYVWLCEIELLDGSTEILAGDVTLVR